MLKFRALRGELPIEIRSTVGLGAKLEWCLEIMAYCEENGLRPQFKFSYPTSSSSEDYFSPFFQIKGANKKPSRYIAISSILELDLGKDYDALLNIELAHHLITKYLLVKEEVISEVDAFCDGNFPNGRVLGVHYRATDKVRESPPVAYEGVRANIEQYLKLYPETDRIFIATDDLHFLNHMHAMPAPRPVVCHDDTVRSGDGSSLHGSARTDKYAVNRDAIVNCLILSRCDALLKTSSILSGWSKLFNPALPTIMLNQPYTGHLWFPERELIKNNLFEPITK